MYREWTEEAQAELDVMMEDEADFYAVIMFKQLYWTTNKSPFEIKNIVLKCFKHAEELFNGEDS